jgi:hypothetical protein
MFKFIKNKIAALRKSYAAYEMHRKRVEFDKKNILRAVESRKKIQFYADFITKQCAYEMKKYGYVKDYGHTNMFVGIIPYDWLTRTSKVLRDLELNSKIKKILNEEKE